MLLVLRDRAPNGAETFVFAGDRGAAHVRVRREQGGAIRLEHGEAVGGRGPDDDRELVREASAQAVELMR